MQPVDDPAARVFIGTVADGVRVGDVLGFAVEVGEIDLVVADDGLAARPGQRDLGVVAEVGQVDVRLAEGSTGVPFSTGRVDSMGQSPLGSAVDFGIGDGAVVAEQAQRDVFLVRIFVARVALNTVLVPDGLDLPRIADTAGDVHGLGGVRAQVLHGPLFGIGQESLHLLDRFVALGEERFDFLRSLLQGDGDRAVVDVVLLLCSWQPTQANDSPGRTMVQLRMFWTMWPWSSSIWK